MSNSISLYLNTKINNNGFFDGVASIGFLPLRHLANGKTYNLQTTETVNRYDDGRKVVQVKTHTLNELQKCPSKVQWLKTALSIIFIIPGILLALPFKIIALSMESVRARYQIIKFAQESKDTPQEPLNNQKKLNENNNNTLKKDSSASNLSKPNNANNQQTTNGSSNSTSTSEKQSTQPQPTQNQPATSTTSSQPATLLSKNVNQVSPASILQTTVTPPSTNTVPSSTSTTTNPPTISTAQTSAAPISVAAAKATTVAKKEFRICIERHSNTSMDGIPKLKDLLDKIETDDRKIISGARDNVKFYPANSNMVIYLHQGITSGGRNDINHGIDYISQNGNKNFVYIFDGNFPTESMWDIQKVKNIAKEKGSKTYDIKQYKDNDLEYKKFMTDLINMMNQK